MNIEGKQLLFICLATYIYYAYAVRPEDKVIIPSLNQTFYLSNETYVFRLSPLYQVPLNIKKHVIYTGSKDKITTFSKRTLFEKRHDLLDLSEEDHHRIAHLLFDRDSSQVPPFVRVNKKKRSLPSYNGISTIPLTKEGHAIIHFAVDEHGKLKRDGDTIPLGDNFCLHIPFFTTCPNDGGTQAVKDAITGATNELWTELDAYTKTNDQRDTALAKTLNTQKSILQSMITIQSTLASAIQSIAEQESINTANLAYGDLVVQSQINYLKRVTNTLLRYYNALSSTDNRQIVAQPSMTELFTSYQLVLNLLESQGEFPIVENNTFTWSEFPLPQDVVTNTAYPPASHTLYPYGTPRPYQGWEIITQISCDYSDTLDSIKCLSDDSYCTCKTSPDNIKNIANTGGIQTGYFYGPFPKSIVGIYTMYLRGNMSKPAKNIVYPVLKAKSQLISHVLSSTTPSGSSPVWSCVQYGPYKGLASFMTTPYMMNGIPTGYSTLNDSDCDAMRLRNAIGNVLYSLFIVKEKVIIPFYSNCTARAFINNNLVSGVEMIGYLAQYPQGYVYSTNSSMYYPDTENTLYTTDPTYPKVDSENTLLNVDMFMYHMVSEDCAINLEPEWIGMSYFLPKPVVNITNIPTGFQMSQFTINPMGELSSSIQFVYTDKWVTTYKSTRVSDNRMITDEIDILDGSTVLFYLFNTTVIDESNNFYGPSNNGRDCIQKDDHYDYDVTSCIFQNDLVSYDADSYFQGLVQTSGMARYINKFDFAVTENPDGTYDFNLTAKNDADFHFYIQPDGTVCPKLVSRSSTTTGCTFQFYFVGGGDSSFGGKKLNFINDYATVTTKFGLLALSVGDPPQDCMLAYCRFSVDSTSTIQFDPPKYSVVDATDLALQTQVYSVIDKTLNGSLSNLQNVIGASYELAESYKNMSALIDQINFNISHLYPYENFTQMRADVMALINGISSSPTSADGISDCSGIFAGVTCFFSNLASTIVTILIVVAIAIGAYCICFKLGIAKMITKKVLGSK